MFRFDTRALCVGTKGMSSRGMGASARFQNDILFDNHIGRATDQEQMFHIVAADQNQLAPAVYRGGIHHRKAGLAHAPAGYKCAAAETANDAENNKNSAKDDCKYKHKADNISRAFTDDAAEPFLHADTLLHYKQIITDGRILRVPRRSASSGDLQFSGQ